MPREKFSFAQQTCVKKAGLVLQRCGSLWPGCRIGVAVSGGMDSFVLLKVMQIRQRIIPFQVEIMAIHLNPGFDRGDHAMLLPWLAEQGIASHLETTNFGPEAHSDENRKRSPCFLCAMRRRKRLFDLCKVYKLTHLALGHNADDLLSTFMLNFCRNGRVEGMSMNETLFAGKLMLIRPLLLVEKKYIRQAARQWRLPVWSNACPSSGATARSSIWDMVDRMRSVLPGAERSMLNALMRWQLDLDISHKDDEAAQH